MSDNADLDDIQAIVRTAFSTLTHCRFLLLRIDEPLKARNWIGRVASLVTSVNQVGTRNGVRKDVDEAVVIAFSYVGLHELGLREHQDYPFPTPFRTGMSSPARAALLGDTDQATWLWRDVSTHPGGVDPDRRVDLLVAHYREKSFGTEDEMLRPAALPRHGVSLIRQIDTCPYYTKEGKEPFGFKDGIAQPKIAWQSEEAGSARRFNAGESSNDEEVPPGEFILGHVNAYGERAYCPDVEDWPKPEGRHFAHNGSYLAVRQIEQYVDEYRKFEQRTADFTEQGSPTVVEKIIGRKKCGAPLVSNRDSVAPQGSVNDDFLFRVEDAEGFLCPRGSHIRRANPRDALGWDVESGVTAAKLHRLLRRGRVYTTHPVCGEPGTAACISAPRPEDCGEGLFFIALNTDLDRQFEFVQKRWISSSKFADLWDESDPALGVGSNRAFSMPGRAPIGRRRTDLPQFTAVKGGGYFFLPSLSALRFIANGFCETGEVDASNCHRGATHA